MSASPGAARRTKKHNQFANSGYNPHATKSNKAYVKTDNFPNFETSLPIRKSIRYLRSESKRENIKINVMTNELGYVKTGKESEWDKNSFYA
jgi:hypothetical protein